MTPERNIADILQIDAAENSWRGNLPECKSTKDLIREYDGHQYLHFALSAPLSKTAIQLQQMQHQLCNSLALEKCAQITTMHRHWNRWYINIVVFPDVMF